MQQRHSEGESLSKDEARHLASLIRIPGKPLNTVVQYIDSNTPFGQAILLDPKLKKSLFEFAKEQAKTLGLPLYSKEAGEGNPSNTTLQSLGGPAPFEYVDAEGGVHPNSIWSIQNVRLIN